MGSISDLVKDLPNVKIYATKFTKFVLEEFGIEKNIVEIKPHKKINFENNISIFPISVSHSIPDAVMYVINSKDGAICYTGDFVIDPTMLGSYDMDLGKIGIKPWEMGVNVSQKETIIDPHTFGAIPAALLNREEER
jgi:ribonuclease J